MKASGFLGATSKWGKAPPVRSKAMPRPRPSKAAMLLRERSRMVQLDPMRIRLLQPQPKADFLANIRAQDECRERRRMAQHDKKG